MEAAIFEIALEGEKSQVLKATKDVNSMVEKIQVVEIAEF
jgi:hypothetical protein